MKKFALLPSLCLFLSLSTFAHLALASSANWNSNPSSGDWNTAANWTPATVPNGPADTATFDSSSQANISVSAATEVSEIVFDPGASAFTIAPKIAFPALVLTISGAGITNNSGIIQNLATHANGGKTGEIHFTNSASAGSGIFITNHGSPIAGSSSLTQFFDNATAGSATIVNEGAGVTGADGSGATFFNDTSSAGTGVFINERNQVGDAGYIYFNDTSSAANGIFTNDGFIFFNDASSAADGIFTNSLQIDFGPGTSAAFGTYTVTGGEVSGALGGVIFFDGNSDHASVRVEAGAVTGAFGGAIQFDSGTGGNAYFNVEGATISGAGGGTVAFSFGAAGGDAIFDLGGGTVSGAGGALMICSDEGSQSFPNAQNATLRVHGGTNGGDGADLEF